MSSYDNKVQNNNYDYINADIHATAKSHIVAKNHNDPFLHMLTDLEKHHDNIVYNNPIDIVRGTTKTRYTIEASKFVEIKSKLVSPKKMAFVDGGNDTLDQSPNHLVVLNRVHYAIFSGSKKIPTKRVTQNTTFLSCVVPHIESNSNATIQNTQSLKFDTRLYTFNDELSYDCLPEKNDLLLLSSGDKKSTVDDTMPLASLPRRLAEIRLAIKIVSEELDSGDMLVMDGSLQTPFGLQGKYADFLYNMAIKKGVIICGLAKTSRLITESGNSLLSRINEISHDVPYDKWYVPVAEKIYDESRGFTLCVKLHPNAKFVFRLDILNEQFQKMTDAEKNNVLANLACNSNDLMILGYPYGAIETDKHAKIRTSEAVMYKRILYSKRIGNEKWQNIAKHSDSIIFHDLLNRVTG